MLLGGVFALLVRAELLTPGKTLMEHDTYNHMFTLHGAVMVFLFIIPSVPAALGKFRPADHAGGEGCRFPRLNLGSFYLWVAGAVLFMLALVMGSLDTGWTFLHPVQFIGDHRFSGWGDHSRRVRRVRARVQFDLHRVELRGDDHTLRPPGMTWFRMPLFLWALYGTSVIQLLATPVLGITLLLLILERTMGIGIFDPARGGDPVLFQHFFWFYSHPCRIHHDFARDGHYQRTDPHVQP